MPLATAPTEVGWATLAAMARHTDPPRPTDTWSDEVAADTRTGAPAVAERYSAVESLGQGNIGVVKLVFDHKLGRKVAYKQLKSAQSGNAVARFLREATITAQLDHPGIVAVHDIGREADGTRFYTMRYVRGDTLAARMGAAQTLPARLALVSHFGDLCQAVGYAHSKGVIHRDLKPANVMVGDFGETQILDWGLAKTLDDADDEVSAIALPPMSGDVAATVQGALVGTPAYMSPEQAAGRPADARSDVWSLGVMLYELLSGVRPFAGGDAYAVVRLVRIGERDALLDAAPGAPAELVAIADKAMARAPGDRYPDARALAADVEAWMTGAPVSALRYTRGDRLRRFAWAYRLPLSVVGTAVLALGAVGTVSFGQIVAERNRARAAEREATRGLRDLYADRAVEAVDEGRFADATLFAVASLGFGEDPEARGLVLAGSDARWPTLLGTLDVACNDAAFLGEDTVVCASTAGLLLWDVAGASVRRVIDAPVWVVAPWPGGGVGVFDRAEGAWRVAADGAVTPLPPARPGGSALFVVAGADGTWIDAAGSSVRASPAGGPPSVQTVPSGPLSGVTWHARRGFTVSTMSSPTWSFDPETMALDAIPGTQGLGARHVAWSADGEALAIGTTDGGVHVVDPDGGAPTRTFAAHGGPVNSVAWLFDDAALATASEAGVLSLDRVADGSRIAQFSLPTASALAVSPGGRLLAFDHNQPLARVFDVRALIAEPATHRVVGEGLATAGFLPGGDVVGFYGSGALRVWRRDGGRDERAIADALLKAGAPSPDGRFIAAGVTNGDLVVLNADLTERFRVATRGVVGLAITDDARWVIASVRAVNGPGDSGVIRVDAQTGAWTWLFEDAHGPRDLDTRGDLVAFVDTTGHAHAIDLLTGARWSVDSEAREAAVQGPGVVWLGAEDGTVSRWRLDDGSVQPRFLGDARPHGAPIDGLAVSDDGAFVATASWDQTAAVWEADTGALRAVLRGHTNRVADVAFSADGGALVTASWDGTIRRWDLGRLRVDPAGIGAEVTRQTGLALTEGRVVPVAGLSPP